MRRGFLLSTPREPRKTAAPATGTDSRPTPSLTKPSKQEKKPTPSVPPSTTVIPLPARCTFWAIPPDYPPDIMQRAANISEGSSEQRASPSEQTEGSGPPELLTTFLHYNGIVDALRAQYPGWPQVFSCPSPPVYKIVPVEGAGLGMVATADITAGEVIVRERPLLLMPKAMPTTDRELLARITAGVVHYLNPENRRAFNTLTNCKGKTMPTEEEGIINTNCFMCNPIPAYDGKYVGVARDCSRANHSCSPNAKHCFDAATLTQSLRAFRDIRAGEEITVSYTDFFLPNEKRKEELKRRYFFDCKCKSCRLTGQAREHSNIARAFINSCAMQKSIAREDAAFEQWLANGAKREAPVLVSPEVAQLDPFGMAEVEWNMMVHEGCFARELWEPVLTRLVKGYAVLENAERVRFFATKAAELRTLYTEEDGGWRAVAENPRLTEWWGKRGVNSKV